MTAPAMTAFEVNLFGLAEALNKRLSDPLVLIWRRKFGHLPDDLFGRAVVLAVGECTFFPSPSEFGRFIEAALPPEERSLLQALRLTRSWLARGVVPVTWDGPRLARTKAALGLPPPSASDLAYLARCRAERGWPDRDPETATVPGTIEHYLFGAGALGAGDGGTLLALVSGAAGVPAGNPLEGGWRR